MTTISGPTFWEGFYDEAINEMRAAIEAYPDLLGVAIYRDENLTSAPRPARFLVFGPSCSAKNLEDAKKYRPTWAHGFTGWCEAKEVKGAIPPPFIKVRPAPQGSPPAPPDPTKEGLAFIERVSAPFSKYSHVALRPIVGAAEGKVFHGVYLTQLRAIEEGHTALQYEIAKSDSYYVYSTLYIDKELRAKTCYHWDRPHPQPPWINPSLCEWYAGGYQSAPGLTAYCLNLYTPLSYGPYKDHLIDEGDRKQRRRRHMTIRFLDGGDSCS